MHGTLLDFPTGTPAAGVRVMLTASDSSATGEATSDAAGRYAVGLSGSGRPLTLAVWLDGSRVGDAVVSSASWRGDLFANGAACVSRCGLVVDAAKGSGVSGAAVTVGGTTVTSAADGWYRIDLGCPPGGVLGFNTSFAEVTHPQYDTLTRVVGRGIARVERLDLALTKR